MEVDERSKAIFETFNAVNVCVLVGFSARQPTSSDLASPSDLCCAL